MGKEKKTYAAPPMRVITMGGAVLFTWSDRVPLVEIVQWMGLFMDMDYNEESGQFTDARCFSGLVMTKFEGAAAGEQSWTLLHSSETEGPSAEAHYLTEVDAGVASLVDLMTAPQTRDEAHDQQMQHFLDHQL